MIKNILVLGSGSAGLIAAISLRRKIPQITVKVVRSPDIGGGAEAITARAFKPQSGDAARETRERRNPSAS